MQISPAGHTQPCLSPLKTNSDECSSPFHTKSEKFQDEALFLRLGSPFTHMNQHENRAFRKRVLNQRNLKTPAVRFSVDRKHLKGRVFETMTSR